jgi:hypothetical protein
MQRLLTVGLLIFTFVSACTLSAELGPCVDVAFTADADGSSQRYVLRLPVDFNPAKSHDLLIACTVTARIGGNSLPVLNGMSVLRCGISRPAGI